MAPFVAKTQIVVCAVFVAIEASEILLRLKRHSVSKVQFFVQKVKILEKFEKWAIFFSFFFFVKIDFFSGKKFEIFEFSRLLFLISAILGQNRDFWPKSFNI